jgi:UDP-glucuronate decarboxylase
VIRWVSEQVGTGAWERVDPATDAFRLDVRDLVDKSGNQPAAVRRKIEQALDQLGRGRRVVVCCDYGMSRSSAIAAGIIALKEGVDFDAAVRSVMSTTGEKSIRIEVLDVVRRAVSAPGAEGARERAAGHGARERARGTAGGGAQARAPGVDGGGEAPAGAAGAGRARPAGRRSVLVTGGSGYVGRAVSAALGAAHEVAAPGREALDLLSEVIALDQIVRQRAVDTILHLANPRIYTTNAALGEALVMLKNVLDVCVQQDVHLVFLSGWEVFSGYRARHLLADESLAPRPGTNYGHAKLLCERLLAQVAEQAGLRHTLVRAGPVYGPGSPKPKFIWNFAEKAARGDPIVTHRYLNGHPSLDLLHVDDLVAGLVQVVERRPGETLHLGTGVSTTTRRIADLIVDLTGSSSKVTSTPIAGYSANVAMDATRARAVLGWRPRHRIATDLREMLAEGDPVRRPARSAQREQLEESVR